MKAHAWKDDRCTRCGVIRKNFAHETVDLDFARGTPAPQYPEDYQEGYRQGLEAFNNAMMAAFKRLGGG